MARTKRGSEREGAAWKRVTQNLVEEDRGSNTDGSSKKTGPARIILSTMKLIILAARAQRRAWDVSIENGGGL